MTIDLMSNEMELNAKRQKSSPAGRVANVPEVTKAIEGGGARRGFCFVAFDE